MTGKSRCQPALPKPRSSTGDAVGSALCQATGNGATHSWPNPATINSLVSGTHFWALESISSAPWDDLTPKFSSSSPSHSHSPAIGLQKAHGDTSNIHPEATSNRGSIKRTCTIQEASTAAHKEQDINTDCSSEDLEIKKKKTRTKVLIEPSHSALFLHCLCLMETKHISICVSNYRLTISV